MATDKSFADYVCEQIRSAGDVSSRKMFGEYMVYCDKRPVFLLCDNTVFVKQLPETMVLFERYGRQLETGMPYKGAKPHYILDADDGEFATEMAKMLASILPIPKPKAKKGRTGKNRRT